MMGVCLHGVPLFRVDQRPHEASHCIWRVAQLPVAKHPSPVIALVQKAAATMPLKNPQHNRDRMQR